MPTLKNDIANLLEESYKKRVGDLELSISLADEAKLLSEKAGADDLKAKANSQLSLYHMILGDFDKAVKLANEALSYFIPKNDRGGIAEAHYTIASVQYKSNNYHEGLRHLLKCLKLYRELNDVENEARVLKAMGTIYEYFGDEANAIESYEKSVEASRMANAPNLESNAYNPLSGIYLNQGNIMLAEKVIEHSINLKEASGDHRGMGFALYGRGKVHVAKKQYDLAETDYLKSLEIHKEMGDHLGFGMTYLKLGELHFVTDDLEKAWNATSEALQVSKSMGIILLEYKAYHLAYRICKKQQRMEEALEYLEKFQASKDRVINSETYHIIKSYNDISKIEALERNAKIQKEKSDIVEKKNIELDSFFYRISHDLKGPISSLMGLHDLMERDIDGDMKSYLQMNKVQVNRINTIVMELINLTRMNHEQDSKTKIDFDSLIKGCIESYKYLPHFDDVEFDVSIELSKPYYSEWSIINTVLQNLIENSIKYARKSVDSWVKIRINETTNCLLIEVSDNGYGISEKHQKHIFDMFYRAHEGTDGTGLGLYILKRAIERLTGTVELKSSEGNGSSFYIRLPLN